MKNFIKTVLIFSSLLLLATACYNDNEYDLYPFPSTKCDSTNATYSKSIVPIVSANCNSCHSAAVASGNVITDNYTSLSTVALNGKLWGGVSWQAGFMPMPNGGSQLSPCDLGKIKNWINQGAPNN